MYGQLWFCPACGREHAVDLSERLECDCGALWTFSCGRKNNGDIDVVKVERWR